MGSKKKADAPSETRAETGEPDTSPTENSTAGFRSTSEEPAETPLCGVSCALLKKKGTLGETPRSWRWSCWYEAALVVEKEKKFDFTGKTTSLVTQTQGKGEEKVGWTGSRSKAAADARYVQRSRQASSRGR